MPPGQAPSWVLLAGGLPGTVVPYRVITLPVRHEKIPPGLALMPSRVAWTWMPSAASLPATWVMFAQMAAASSSIEVEVSITKTSSTGGHAGHSSGTPSVLQSTLTWPL